jgi:nucleoside-diphosphate-sugar epimerase
MKTVVAGASGVVGQALIPILIQEGHDVVGFTRNSSTAIELKKKGIEPVVLYIYSREAVFSALQETKPDAVIHQLTSLSARNFSDNARIRKEGTRNLVDAALAADVGKMIVQSAWYAPGGYMASQARERLLPATGGISSFVHVDDAARAAACALSWPSGCCNIVDDESSTGAALCPR